MDNKHNKNNMQTEYIEGVGLEGFNLGLLLRAAVAAGSRLLP